MDLNLLTKDRVEKILRKYFHVCLVTKDEDVLLTKNKLRSVMPNDWNKEDVWARYRAVGIELPEV